MYCLRRALFLSIPATVSAVLALSSCGGPQARPVMTASYEGINLRTGERTAKVVYDTSISDRPFVVGTEDRVTQIEVERVAERVDKGFEDGWICGREPRIFKSPYGKLSAERKAKFAMAYHDFLEIFHQDLANDRSTYLPYSKRTAFARKYWENSDVAASFKKEQEKYQVAWIHESLLDGSELWWRAAELRFGPRITSAATLSHDTEQNMVFKYMEDQNTESTFSAQIKPKEKHDR